MFGKSFAELLRWKHTAAIGGKRLHKALCGSGFG